MFVVVLNTQRMQHNKSRKIKEKKIHRNLCVLFCFYSFCAALTDGTVCSMRMFIFVRFELLIPCSTCKWCTALHTAIRTALQSQHIVCGCLSNVALCCCCCFSSYVFVIRSCAISLYFISLPIRLCFFTYFMFIFIFHHWLSLFVRLTHLYWNKRAQLMVCLDFFCSQFHLSVYSIQYAFSVLVLNVLSPVSRLYVCVFFSLAIIVIARMASCCLVLLVNFQVVFLFFVLILRLCVQCAYFSVSFIQYSFLNHFVCIYIEIKNGKRVHCYIT